MTVFENVFVAAGNGGGLDTEEANVAALEAIELCGMMKVANRRAESLGLLDRKRLELARALDVLRQSFCSTKSPAALPRPKRTTS